MWAVQSSKRCSLSVPLCAEKLAASVGTSYGCYFVPAFSGLYAPYWEPSARGWEATHLPHPRCCAARACLTLFSLVRVCGRIICGLTQFTNKSHVAFAALEAVGFQTREVGGAIPTQHVVCTARTNNSVGWMFHAGAMKPITVVYA